MSRQQSSCRSPVLEAATSPIALRYWNYCLNREEQTRARSRQMLLAMFDNDGGLVRLHCQTLLTGLLQDSLKRALDSGRPRH